MKKATNIIQSKKILGWKKATLTSNFKPYNDNEKYRPTYRKYGKIVEISGVITPSKTLNGSSNGVTIFTLPERI